MNNTVAITGGTGFIGKYIVQHLLSQGYNVRGLTRSAHHDLPRDVTWVGGALEDQGALAELVRGADCIVHCAGQVRGHREEIFTSCNVTGSLRLMQAAKEHGCCRRFLFISSLAARCPELSWYANSKYVAERELAAIASDISLGILRPTAVYGSGDKELNPLFRWLLRGVLPRIGAADAQFSFLHVTDLAEAVCQWIRADLPQNTPYELCDAFPGGYSWARLQQIGAAVRQRPVHLLTVPLPLLKLFASISSLSSRLAGHEPMLTQSKVHELTWRDWSASHQSFSDAVNWLPRMSLERALREGLF